MKNLPLVPIVIFAICSFSLPAGAQKISTYHGNNGATDELREEITITITQQANNYVVTGYYRYPRTYAHDCPIRGAYSPKTGLFSALAKCQYKVDGMPAEIGISGNKRGNDLQIKEPWAAVAKLEDTKPTPPSSEQNKQVSKKAETSGGRCTPDESAAFAKMTGSWKSPNMKVTISGSCDKATGTMEWAEYCSNMDDPNNKDRRYPGTFTGNMASGYLSFDWKLPGQGVHKDQTGTSTCSLQANGTLSCTFGCGGALKKQ